jgi:hypothetical protein
MAAILVLFAGCRTKDRNGNGTFLERAERRFHSNSAPPGSSKLAEEGRKAIATECGKQSYENALKGLIVSETGLHEDVFALRDRSSYTPIAYELDDALRLEELLEAEVRNGAHPAEQADCIQEFTEHLETLTDPLVEANKIQQDLDVSAFKDAAKEAESQTDKQAEEKPSKQNPQLHP